MPPEISIDSALWDSTQKELHDLRGELTVAYAQLQLVLRYQRMMTKRTKQAVDMVRDLHQRMLSLQLEALAKKRQEGDIDT